MDSFDNPEQFENSSIVEKSSKTGIFSNKRLLVIKNGYLYYFSKVPKGYKSHVPNILTTFTDLPKCSIEIKNILQIRLQSTKSSNLIIKFYLKDMIDREDIRKSIDSNSYMLPNKKINSEIDQWKFLFTTVLQCRLWYNALMKLKEYFKNLDNKFKDFVANFDKKTNDKTDIKQHRTQTQLKNLLSTPAKNLPDDSNPTKFQKARKTEPINFDPLKFIGSFPQKQPSPMPSPKSQTIKSQTPNQAQKLSTSKAISEQEQNSQNGYHPDISNKIQPQIPQSYSQKLKKTQSFQCRIKESHFIEPINQQQEIKIKLLEDQIREELKLELEKQLRKQMEQKMQEKIEQQKIQQAKRFQAEVELKELKIKQLETEIHIKHLANMQKQKQIEQQKKQLQQKIYQQQEKLKQYKISIEKQNQERQTNKNKNQNKILEAKPNPTSLGNATNLDHVQSEIHSFQNNNQKAKKQKYFKNIQKINSNQWFMQQNQQTKRLEGQDLFINKNRKNANAKQIIRGQNQIQVHQFSVQTDEEQLPCDQTHPFKFAKDNPVITQLNLSKSIKARSSSYLEEIPSHRTSLLSQRFKVQAGFLASTDRSYQSDFSSYNYFDQLKNIFQKGISSSERIQKQIKLHKYINFVKEQVVEITRQFLDKNKVTNCLTFQKGIFSFEIACAQGKIMNIGGQSKLIYSNKVHENLKRTFKIHQYIQREILKILKNKPSFPVRVPLCTLVEYKGYTILGKVEICSSEQDLISKDKYLKHMLPYEFYSKIHLSKTIETGQNTNYLMIKVLKPFKITNEQKNSMIFKSEDNFSFYLGQIIKSRESGISICYQKLKREYEERLEDKSQSSRQNESKQVLSNQLWVLKLIRLMRELKKLFKTMQPYNQMQLQDGNLRSQFVETLLSNPNQLFQLIPLDFDINQVSTQSGYFWSLLQFFLGIRIHDTVSKNSSSNLSYSFVPLSRTFHFASLLSTQYCQKLNNYLLSSNIESLQNCSNLFKKISSNPEQIQLMDIKILLKRKEYQTAQNKIKLLRQSLSVHDLRNIQINAFLIECYVFVGLESEALKEIKDSLGYVEYLFGSKKNVFQRDLFLLMAETLLKMGKSNESINLYKTLIKHQKIGRQQLIVSFTQSLLTDNRFETNQVIPFLLQCLEQLKNPSNKTKILTSIGEMYLILNRKDKSLFYLQKAYQMSLSEKLIEETLRIYEILIKYTKTQDIKNNFYKSVIQSQLLRNQQTSKDFNTINLYHLIVSRSTTEVSQITQQLEKFLPQIKRNLLVTIQSVIDWQQLKSFVHFLLIRGNSLNEMSVFSKTLSSVDIEKVIRKLKNNQDKQSSLRQ